MKKIALGTTLLFTILLSFAISNPLSANTLAPDHSYVDENLDTTLTINPVADAFVDQTNPGTNFGTAAQLRSDGSPIRRSYVRFNVQGLTGAVGKATLRVYANSALAGGYNVYRVGNNSWSESTINYSNAPLLGMLLGSSGPVAANTWTSVNVTLDLIGNGTFSLAIVNPSATALSLASRESPNKPELVITVRSTGSPTPTRPAGTLTPAPKPSSSPTATTDAVLVGAGDIAICGRPGDEETAKLVEAIPGQVATFGDNSNDEGTAYQFANCYDPAWGRFKGRTRPAVGNHDYLTSNAVPYYTYFGAAAGTPGKGYYSYNLGAWHIVVINSMCSEAGGCGVGSPQERWLRADLAAHPTKCTLAYWHHPRFSSGMQGNYTSMQPIWQALYDNHAEIVLNGHDHDYERFALQDPTGKADPVNGIREFVVGTGGAGYTKLSTTKANSEVRHTGTFGVIKFTLHPNSYDWQFIPVAGGTFTDSGTAACR